MNTTSDPIVAHAISALLLHPMNLAKYLVVADMGPPAWRHYALSIPYYTHFTSPIRRYADVMVHRLLDLSIRDPNAAATEGTNQTSGQTTKRTFKIHTLSYPLMIHTLSYIFTHISCCTHTYCIHFLLCTIFIHTLVLQAKMLLVSKNWPTLPNNATTCG